MAAPSPRPRCSHPFRIAVGVALATMIAPPMAASAQTAYSPEEERWLDAGWPEEVAFAAANALLGGVVVGLFRAFSEDGSFVEGFRAGAAGGVVAYTGKRLAAERFGGAGLLGRQVASVGGSIASNARDGRGAFERLVFPLGLGRLYWDRTGSRVTFRPDVATLYYTVLGLASSRVSLDWSRTLSAGAPVFLTQREGTTLDDNAAGRAYGGVVVVDVNSDLPPSHIAAHERVHVVQYDQHCAIGGEAAERGLTSLLGDRATGVLGRVDLGIGLAAFAPFRGSLSRANNPLEIEADFLTVR